MTKPVKFRRLLEWFGIATPSPFDVEVDSLIARFQRQHAQNIECLICKAVEIGINPRDIRLCWRSDGDKMITWIEIGDHH